MEETRTPNKSTRRPLRVAAIAMSSAAAVALLVGLNTVPATSATSTTTPIVAVPASGYADLVEKVMPAVVSVTVKRMPAAENVTGPRSFGGPENQGPDAEMFRRFMERFFGERGMEPFQMPQMPKGQPMMAAGTGFIFDKDGYIATNNHVVEDAGEVTVTMSDGTEKPATVVGTDPDTDLAVLKIESDKPLPYVQFADSDTVRVGDPVVAIGNPFGLGDSVTAGIVSAEHRVIGAGRFDDFMQIDAPINRGNSGGPTFDLEGKVIGINTAINSPNGGNVGIGFAIPSNLAKQIVMDLREHGQVSRGWLGVYIQGIDEDLAKNLGLDSKNGALVAQVTPDSPAAAAGLEQGDVILSYNGKPIKELRDLTTDVASTDPGTGSKMKVWRNGEERTVDVEIGKTPGSEKVMAAAEQPSDNTPKLGVALAELTPEARQQLDLPAGTEGAVVTAVQPDSPAAEKGLQRGDVILEVDHHKVTAPSMVADAVREAAQHGNDTVLLLVKREGQDRFVAVRLERA